jgi:FlaA1/EpsC-like NDP-sugar epimerase
VSLVALSRDVEHRLLGRPVRRVLTGADRKALAGQRILITGAGGTVGSELARQLLACGPERLMLLDHSEYALFRIERELRESNPDARVDVALGDVTRRADIAGACRTLRPDVVYHAAAAKHVTIGERSIVPAVRTNVLGTVETVRAARAAGARFVLISSDKAAESRSVMGATKRLAELAALGLASPGFRPVAVRFGNILGSSGSLVEIMARCVEEGRDIPVTHPDATRFFMTAEEAVALVLKADLLGEQAEVFWLDMGDPIRIGDLAERFIACATPAGRTPVGIAIIGLRPGEKMREELTTHGLAMQATEHPSIWAARQRRVRRETVLTALRTLQRAVASGDAEAALSALEGAVADFTASAAARSSARAATPGRPRRVLLRVADVAAAV